MERAFKHSAPRENAVELIPAFFAGKRDLWLCAILFRTADVLPGFPTEFLISSDSAVWIDAALRYGTAASIPKELVRYRVHLSTTNSTPIAIWHQELRQLRDLAIQYQAKRNGPNPQFERLLTRTVDHLNMRMVSNGINQTHKNAKWRGLREYLRSLYHFRGLSGVRILSRGIALLSLSGRPTTHLKRLRNLIRFRS